MPRASSCLSARMSGGMVWCKVVWIQQGAARCGARHPQTWHHGEGEGGGRGWRCVGGESRGHEAEQ